MPPAPGFNGPPTSGLPTPAQTASPTSVTTEAPTTMPNAGPVTAPPAAAPKPTGAEPAPEVRLSQSALPRHAHKQVG